MNLRNNVLIVLIFVSFFGIISNGRSEDKSNISIGAYYFPGWATLDLPWTYGWKSIKLFPEREPFLSWYPEEKQWVSDVHLSWAYNFGIDFFAYDWYWDGKQTILDHAIKNYLNSPLKNKVKLSLLWANHSEVPHNWKEFDDMLTYWIDNYFSQSSYYKIDGKPVIFVFSYSRLDQNAKTFGETGKSLLERANKMIAKKGFKGIYFVATTNEAPSDGLENKLLKMNYSAYTGWNYVVSKDTSKVADYDSFVDTYLSYYNDASKTKKILPYIVPASPGWDSSPWHGVEATRRENPTPEKFKKMLIGRTLLDSQSRGPRILIIEAWNEFGEGAYIEPTKEFDFKYLEAIGSVFQKK